MPEIRRKLGPCLKRPVPVLRQNKKANKFLAPCPSWFFLGLCVTSFDNQKIMWSSRNKMLLDAEGDGEDDVAFLSGKVYD